MTDDLLTPEQLGKTLGDISKVRVLEMRKRYDWPHVRLGRRIRFTEEQAAQIIKQHSVQGKKPDTWGRTERSRRSA